MKAAPGGWNDRAPPAGRIGDLHNRAGPALSSIPQANVHLISRSDAPEIEYRLYKNQIKMTRSYDSTIVTMKRLIVRETANEPGGTQFVTDDDEDSVDTADGKIHIHKIPQLPLSKDKYFIVVMYPPDDLDMDDTPMAGDEPVKFLFSLYNLYLTGFSYDEIWHIFNDAMIIGISQESREKYLKELAFPGNYGTIGQEYLKLDIGFAGHCDTYNKIVGMKSKKTNQDQLIRVLCRTIISLPESARFAFLAEFHLINFHLGNFDIVLDKEVLAGEEYRNFSVHLTKWGTYSTMSKNGKKFFKVSVIPTSGIKSFSGLLNFVAIATNKKYDDEMKLLKGEVAKAHNTGDDHAEDKGGNEDTNNGNEDFENKKKVQDDKTWFYQAPVMPYVPHTRQNLNLNNEADVSMGAILKINRKTRLEEISLILLLQLAMREACRYAEEKLPIKVDKLGTDSLVNCAKTSTSSKLIHTYSDFFANVVVEAVQAVTTTNSKREVKYPIKVSVILRGANDFILDVIEPSLQDEPSTVKRNLNSNMVAAGDGGAVEAALSAALGSREQLAIAEFAESWPKVHNELAPKGPSESSGMAKATLVDCMSQRLWGSNILAADLGAKCAWNWYADRAQEYSAHHDRYPLGRFGVVA